MAKKKKHTKVIGYTTGVYDLFHIGHLILLEKRAQTIIATLRAHSAHV